MKSKSTKNLTFYFRHFSPPSEGTWWEIGRFHSPEKGNTGWWWYNQVLVDADRKEKWLWWWVRKSQSLGGFTGYCTCVHLLTSRTIQHFILFMCNSMYIVLCNDPEIHYVCFFSKKCVYVRWSLCMMPWALDIPQTEEILWATAAKKGKERC